MIWIQFGDFTIQAELYSALDGNDKPTGVMHLFARHAGQVGFAAKVFTESEETADKLRKLGYHDVTVKKLRKKKNHAAA